MTQLNSEAIDIINNGIVVKINKQDAHKSGATFSAFIRYTIEVRCNPGDEVKDLDDTLI